MAFSGSLSAWAFNSSAWQLARKRQTGQTGQTFERFSRRISETTLRLRWTRLLLSDLSFQGVYVRPRTFPEPNKGILQRPGYQGLQDLWHRLNEPMDLKNLGNSKKEK